MNGVLKKSFLVFLVLLLSVAFFACDGKKHDPDLDNTNDAKISFSVIYHGTELSLGKSAKTALDSLGEPMSEEEVFDCGEGKSRMLYAFSSFDLYTMKANGEEVIDQIELYDDLTETSEKIAIGSKESAVREAYGEPTSEKNGKLTYTSGDNNLIFEIKDGTVSAIGLLRKTK